MGIVGVAARVNYCIKTKDEHSGNLGVGWENGL